MRAELTTAVVLLAGPSGSGKSTVARLVATALRARMLCLDRCFRANPKLFVAGPQGPVRTYERPGAYDGAALAAEVRRASGAVIVEGFCLLTYPEVLALGGTRFYLDLPFDLCLARRLARRPQRPSDRSFAVVGRAETEAFVVPQMRLPGVRILDARHPPPALAAAILQTLCDPVSGIELGPSVRPPRA
jgi:uridine kinase